MESLTVEVLIVTIVKTVAQVCLERERPNIPGVRSLITSSIYAITGGGGGGLGVSAHAL